MQLLKWFSIPYESLEINIPLSASNNNNNPQKNLHSQMTQTSQSMAGTLSSGISVSVGSENTSTQRISSPTKSHSSNSNSNSHIKMTATTARMKRSIWNESGESIEEKEREQRMKVNNQKPCDLCFSDDKHLVVGYQSGGRYVSLVMNSLLYFL